MAYFTATSHRSSCIRDGAEMGIELPAPKSILTIETQCIGSGRSSVSFSFWRAGLYPVAVFSMTWWNIWNSSLFSRRISRGAISNAEVAGVSLPAEACVCDGIASTDSNVPANRESRDHSQQQCATCQHVLFHASTLPKRLLLSACSPHAARRENMPPNSFSLVPTLRLGMLVPDAPRPFFRHGCTATFRRRRASHLLRSHAERGNEPVTSPPSPWPTTRSACRG